MKKLFITAATAILFSVTAFASNGITTINTGEENISYAVLNKFNSDYKDAKNAAWTVTPNCQKVSFISGGVKMTAFYSLSGDFMGTTQAVDLTAVPEASQKQIASKYSTYTVAEVIKYESDGTNPDVDTLAYFVDLKKADSEIIVRVTPGENVHFFKTIK